MDQAIYPCFFRTKKGTMQVRIDVTHGTCVCFFSNKTYNKGKVYSCAAFGVLLWHISEKNIYSFLSQLGSSYIVC